MMNPYLGTRIILAEPMIENDFMTLVQGDKAVHTEQGKDAGYSVVYPDGYRNWYPKATFEFLYRPFSKGEIGFFQPAAIPGGAQEGSQSEVEQVEDPSKLNLKVDKDE